MEFGFVFSSKPAWEICTDASALFGKTSAYQGALEGSALNNVTVRLVGEPKKALNWTWQ
jgi:hypothetical protein